MSTRAETKMGKPARQNIRIKIRKRRKDKNANIDINEKASGKREGTGRHKQNEKRSTTDINYTGRSNTADGAIQSISEAATTLGFE